MKLREDTEMGTIRNRMTIVHHYDLDEIKKVRENAIDVFQKVAALYNKNYNVAVDMVSPILTSPVNEEFSFVIMGDCSKSGWDMSNTFEETRQKWVKEQAKNVANICIADFSDDEPAFIEEIPNY